jgi:cell division septal protein FtsQ
MTGSLSDNVVASAEERGQFQTPRLEAKEKQKTRKRKMHRVFFIIFLCLLGAFLFANHITSYSVVFQNASQLKEIPNAQTYIQTALNANKLSIGQRFAFSLNAPLLEASLEAQHHEIAAVTIHNSWFDHSPQLTITLRKPVLLWKTKLNPQTFYVDANGITFTVNAYGSDSQLVQVNDDSNVPTTAGSAVANSEQISFLGQLVGSIQTLSKGSLVLSKIVFPPASIEEIDVYFSGKPYYAKVDMDRSPVDQASEIVQALAVLQQKNQLPSQYLDVRIPGRVFFQ